MQASNRNNVVLDANVFHLEPELVRQGFNVTRVPHGVSDSLIRGALENSGARFVTRNFKDFRGLSGVIRGSDRIPKSQEIITSLNSLEIGRVNPEVFTRLPQIPSSGVNLGLAKVPK